MIPNKDGWNERSKNDNSSKLFPICFRHANVDLVAWFFFWGGGGHVQQPCLPKHLGNSSARAWDALWFCSTGLLPSFMWANLTWHMTPLGLVRSFLMLLMFWNPSSQTPTPATTRARNWKTIRSWGCLVLAYHRGGYIQQVWAHFWAVTVMRTLINASRHLQHGSLVNPSCTLQIHSVSPSRNGWTNHLPDPMKASNKVIGI